MKHPKKKKNKPKPPISKPNQNPNPNSGQTVDHNSNNLTEKIALFSIEERPDMMSNTTETASSYSDSAEIFGSSSDAAEIFGTSSDAAEIFGSSSDAAEIFGSSTETGSTSSGSSGLSNFESCSNRKIGKMGKGNYKVVAATGMVAGVIGKDYVPTVTKKRGIDKWKVNEGVGVSHDDAEQFLCSMLSNDCEFGMDFVKDVLCECAYDVEKALDILLELTALSSEPSTSCQHQNLNEKREDTGSLLESTDSLTDSTYDLASSSESDLSMGFNRRNYFDVLAGPEIEPPSGPKNTSELTQDVLESLFNTRKSSKHEPESMNWRNVVKKMESLGPMFDYPSEDRDKKQHVFAKGNDYQNYRTTATQHWDSMKSYYHKAATAYANGKREYAGYLSDQGRMCNEKARQADKRASQDIFTSRNKDFENMITIDLHGQHVKQGMKLLKLHLLFGAYVRSVRLFRVITGCGSHGFGKSKLKQSVVNLLESENIEWKEENRGTLLIKLNGQREFSFLDSSSDSE